jgi:chromosomal replication initiator protein
MSVSSRQNGNDHLWSEFLASVATLVNKQTFETWFKPMRLSSVDGSRVTIDCPSKFFVEWVSEHHSDKIQFALRQVIGLDPQVSLQNANDTPPEILRRPEISMPSVAARSRRPLFIYGGVGLGKTHLMQGIGHGVLQRQPHARVHYCSAESFMNEMIMAIRQGNSHEFRTKYRNVDLLLIDDIQFLAGKESTQEEFFHTFNALHGANKQIVVTSDRPPKEIPTLEDRLVSRFEWGLITDIQQPDYETRLAILRKKVERENIMIPDDVLALIADSVKSNIRELEGSLVKLLVHASVYKKDVNIEMAHDVLKDFVKSTPKKTSISLIQKIVSQHYRVPVESMRSKVRTARLAFPRQVAIYLAREMTQASLAQIGQRFGGRDHTTVIHACQKISVMVEHDVSLRSTISQLRKELST